MKTSVRGWARDCGTMQLSDKLLEAIEPQEDLKFYPHRGYTLLVKRNDKNKVSSLTISHKVGIVLNGNYLHQIELSATDVLYLAWIVMKDRSISTIMKVFGVFEDRSKERRAAPKIQVTRG